jgi:hypothetical protein
MPVPIPAVNVELGIGDTIRAIGETQNRAREDLRRQQDKALTELRQQLDITLTVIFKLENLFIEILRGYRNPEITGNREALQEHLNQTRMLLESRNLLPYLDHARGAIEAAASSSRFKSADYREMVEGLQELAGKLYSWRMALGPGGLAAVRAAVHVAFQNWLHHGKQRQAVTSGDQVDGRAHQRGAHRALVRDQRRQVVEAEALQPRSQADVRVVRHLRLRPDQVLDRLGGRERRAAQQKLPLEQGAVERPEA